MPLPNAPPPSPIFVITVSCSKWCLTSIWNCVRLCNLYTRHISKCICCWANHSFLCCYKYKYSIWFLCVCECQPVREPVIIYHPTYLKQQASWKPQWVIPFCRRVITPTPLFHSIRFITMNGPQPLLPKQKININKKNRVCKRYQWEKYITSNCLKDITEKSIFFPKNYTFWSQPVGSLLKCFSVWGHLSYDRTKHTDIYLQTLWACT